MKLKRKPFYVNGTDFQIRLSLALVSKTWQLRNWKKPYYRDSIGDAFQFLVNIFIHVEPDPCMMMLGQENGPGNTETKGFCSKP